MSCLYYDQMLLVYAKSYIISIEVQRPNNFTFIYLSNNQCHISVKKLITTPKDIANNENMTLFIYTCVTINTSFR